jgi:7-cyano-7-deazaguanine synthase
MDSTAALYESHTQHDVVGALSFNYGSKHNEREIPFAKWHCEQLKITHRIVALDFMSRLIKSSLMKFGGSIPDGHYQEDTMKQTVVPFRNGIMLSIAAGYAESAGAQGVVIAAHAGDHAIYPDCREEFMQAMNAAMQAGTYVGLQLLRPFIHLTKAQIVERGEELGVDFAKTWSCYKGGGAQCGTCGTCVERREAFILAKRPDPTVYASTPPLPPKPGK